MSQPPSSPLGFGPDLPPLLVGGPCVAGGVEETLAIARAIQDAVADLDCRWVFKASFDKANRTSGKSPRGPGLADGLKALAAVRSELGVPVMTDVHHPEQCAPVAEVADVLQVPAFLCRQTDLLEAAGRTGRTVNIKKGQFLAPSGMKGAIDKVAAAGGQEILVTERGTCFGYGRLVVDFAGLQELVALGRPVLFDGTHSVQQPGALGDRTDGDWRLAPGLLRAAAAVGVHGFFVETHPNPELSPSDGPNMIPLSHLAEVIQEVLAILRVAQTQDAQAL